MSAAIQATSASATGQNRPRPLVWGAGSIWYEAER
jgi:hypothetical protein